MKHLLRANLNGTQVTDFGLMKLAALKELKNLEIRGTKITEEGRRKFEKLRPDVQVSTLR